MYSNFNSFPLSPFPVQETTQHFLLFLLSFLWSATAPYTFLFFFFWPCHFHRMLFCWPPLTVGLSWFDWGYAFWARLPQILCVSFVVHHITGLMVSTCHRWWCWPWSPWSRWFLLCPLILIVNHYLLFLANKVTNHGMYHINFPEAPRG